MARSMPVRTERRMDPPEAMSDPEFSNSGNIFSMLRKKLFPSQDLNKLLENIAVTPYGGPRASHLTPGSRGTDCAMRPVWLSITLMKRRAGFHLTP